MLIFFFFPHCEVIEELAQHKLFLEFVHWVLARHTSPFPRFFLGSLPSPKPGNLVILIMKKKHVLFKIPAAKYSAMLFSVTAELLLHLGNSIELKI